jgi:hypothetical protein
MANTMSDAELYEAKELCVEMGECTQTYYGVLLIKEVERLRSENEKLRNAAKNAIDSFAQALRQWREYANESSESRDIEFDDDAEAKFYNVAALSKRALEEAVDG